MAAGEEPLWRKTVTLIHVEGSLIHVFSLSAFLLVVGGGGGGGRCLCFVLFHSRG